MKKKKDKRGQVASSRQAFSKLMIVAMILIMLTIVVRVTLIAATNSAYGQDLTKLAKEQYTREIPMKAPRGTIYDRNENPIAEETRTYNVVAIISTKYIDGHGKPLYLQKDQYYTFAQVMTNVLGVETDKIMKNLQEAKADAYQVEFGTAAKNITFEQKKMLETALKNANIKGIVFTDNPARSYPNGIFATHLIGYIKNEENKISGTLGIEASYNTILAGKDGAIVRSVDKYGNELPGSSSETKNAVDGQDIYTTIDSKLQNMLEGLIEASCEKYTPENMTGVLMSAKTGAILAMVQRPTFNPDNKEGLDENTMWRTLQTSDAYEPGSTMKVFTMATAIQNNIFNDQERFLSGKINVEDRTIKDWDNGKGMLTFAQALTNSSNVGMVTLEQRMRAQDEMMWPNSLKRFEFGTATNVGLFGEGSGKLPKFQNPVDMAMSAYGQGITVTTMQMLRGFTAIANQGEMLEPHFIKKYVDPITGKEKVYAPESLGHPVTAETTAKLLDIMRGTIEDQYYGTGYSNYVTNGFHASAKTGTAEVADENHGGYLPHGNYLYSFVEIFPTEDPQYVFFLTCKLPKNYDTRGCMASVANPIVQAAYESGAAEDEFAFATNAYSTAAKADVGNYIGKSNNDAQILARQALLHPVVIGNGTSIINQSLKPGDKKAKVNQKIFLFTDGNRTLPDMTDWTKEEVKSVCDFLRIKVVFVGDGLVTGQSIPYATEFDKDEVLSVVLGK
ncbi:MAG: PASTA domain-containing protein [Lactobacillales bacterium]|jgi:penicillin-binding protein 2X|nr:PASTA domain-containing protein [Lactobacillales bacterium]